MFVCCECCVLSGRGLYDGLITRPHEYYRLWRVVVCDQETSKTRRLKARYRDVENKPTMSCNARKTNNKYHIISYGDCLVLIKFGLCTTCVSSRALPAEYSLESYNLEENFLGKISGSVSVTGEDACQLGRNAV
jgi:hypothetical protein